MAKLTFVLEDGQEIVVPISDHLTLGRSEDNDVVVDDERVSKHHAELVSNADGSIQLFDSSSTAVTFVNGERVHSRTIHPGDRLAFGPLTAVFDLAAPHTHGSHHTPSPRPSGDETQAVTLDLPVKAGKLATRNRRRRGRLDSAGPGHANHQEATALLEAEKTLLLSEVDAIRKELSSLQQQSAAERAEHLAHMESLRSGEEHLAGVKTAIREAEMTHDGWIKSIQDLTTRHQEQTAALQRSIETSQAEEDKRRERLAGLEHRLAELRADIIEAERQRSELRQQADLAHAELKNFEAAIDRISKKTAD